MIAKIIIEGILLGTLLVLFCAVGIRNGAVNMVFLYHRDVQDRCVQNGLITREKIRQNSPPRTRFRRRKRKVMKNVFARCFHPSAAREKRA